MKIHKIIFSILAFVSIFINIIWFVVDIITLKNPQIVGYQVITMIFFAMIIPLFLSVFLFFKYQKIKRFLKIFLTIVLVFSILVSGIYSLAVAPFLEIISTTDNINNYLKTDISGNNTYSTIFPSKIPENSMNQSYYYAYEDNQPFHQDIYMMARWTLPENEYIKEKQRILSQYPRGVFKYNDESQMTDYFVGYSDPVTLIFSYSDENKTVQYIYEGLTGRSKYIHRLYYNRDIGNMDIITL